ncbi:MAG: hypothetical protein K0R50_4079 [Eubacterium sp.]|nr:hypothetical protein [Eubacterium sp.]
MTNTKSKKILTIILISLFILSELFLIGIPTVNADVTDVKLFAFPTGVTNAIYSGDEFNMVVRVGNSTGTTITHVNVVIDGSSSFAPVDSIPEIASISSGNQSPQNTYKFKYDGGSNKLLAVITYNIDDNVYQQEVSVTIAQAKPDSSSPSTPTTTDPNKYAPKLIIANNSAIPYGDAGSSITYTLPLKNISKYPAKNIVISPVLDDSVPIVIESMNISQTLDTLKQNETKEVQFNFKISESAQKKTYPIKFNIQCNNYYSNDYFSFTETGYLKIESISDIPKLILKTLSTNPSPVIPGENFKLNFSLENEGALAAKNVSVTLSGLKNDGVSIVGTTNKQTKSNIYGYDTSDFSFDLAAAKKIEAGANSLKIKVDYTDTSGTARSEEMEFFITVQGSDTQTIVELKNMVSPGTTLYPGSNGLVAFDVVNTGNEDAKNVKVSVTADKEIIPRTQNTIIIPTLKKGDTKNVQFQLFVSDDAVTKNYPVAINVEYDVPSSGTATKQTVSQYVGFYVENKSGKTVPRLIIDKYSIEPKTLNAGQEFTLNLSILNTSKSAKIQNVKVSIASDDGTFTTVDSNSFYIDGISPKSRLQKKIVLSSKPDAAAKQYMLSINYEYEDDKGTAYTNKDTIGIPLQQTQRLTIGELNISSEAFVGNPIPVNISFYNMGKSTLYNLMIKLDGKFKVEGSSYFVGNFEPGKTDSFDGTIIPDAPGKISGSVLFTYEDAAGKAYEVRKEISANVTEMPVPQEPGIDGQLPVDPSTKKIPLWAYIAGGVV